MENYSLGKHIHIYACWCASRAVQRGWENADNKSICNAINESALSEILFKKDERPKNISGFDEWHEKITIKILSSLKKCENNYGRAAKIIAIYLKTAILLPEGDNKFTRIMHPPIDRILLKNLSKELANKNKSTSDYFDGINWTQLNKDGYYFLINKMRELDLDKPFFWKLEKYWDISE